MMRNRSKFSFSVFVVLAFILFFTSLNFTYAQHADSIKHIRAKKKLLWTTASVYSLGMTGLSLAWYDQKTQSFSWFNDLAEWKQMDKAGHVLTTFHLTRLAYSGFLSTGMESKKAALKSGLISAVAMSSIELLDGYSPDYGASLSDIGSNFLGSIIFLFQAERKKGLLITPKFSFHQTGIAGQRPGILGKNYAEQVLKDYNGQTYWLSADMDQFTSLPKWINLSIGYGATDMRFGRDFQNEAVGLDPYRKWYLGLDIDLSDIETNHRILKKIFSMTRIIRIPAPAIQFSKKGIQFNPMAF